MEILNDKNETLILEYPCNWCYKVIALNEETLREAVEGIVQRDYTLSLSNRSKSGKYTSMNLDILVHNEDDRTYIFEALKKHQHIKMVL